MPFHWSARKTVLRTALHSKPRDSDESVGSTLLSEYRRLTETALTLLGDEGLVAHIAVAREAGDADGAKAAAGHLAWGFEEIIRVKVRMKVPSGAVDDVVGEVLLSVLGASFDGKILGQFRAFLNTIIKYRIADFHRAEERRPDQDPLPSGYQGDEEVWGTEPAVGDSADIIALLDAIERVIATRNELHQRIIRLYGPDPFGEALSGAGAVERLAAEGEIVSVDNVQQVWRRFKVDLAKDLDSGEDGGNPDG
jgi:hypothetical protein